MGHQNAPQELRSLVPLREEAATLRYTLILLLKTHKDVSLQADVSL